jgi:hypothetical protein
MAAIAAGVAATVIGGAVQSGKAHKQMRGARGAKRRAAAKVKELQDGRSTITNPYAGVQSLAGMATDLSNQMSNPFSSLGVATQAAEIQMEQSDIALANSLDAMVATGAGAGGATALAQAALRSKKGVSASIESQEAQNEKLRAQGEQQLEQQRVAEQRRLQGIQIGEGQRMQGLDAAGKQFMFGAQETRELQQLNRVSTQLGGAQAQQMQASADQTGAYTSMVGGLASIAGSTIGAMAQVRSSPWNADGTPKTD